MASEPRFTVLLPVYNGADFVADAIDSVVLQTVHPSKFLIVDDGSTDGTFPILQSYEKKFDFIQVIKCPINLGLVGALKYGLVKVETDWVLRLDADDTWLPNHVESISSVISSSPNLVMCANRTLQCTKPYTNLSHEKVCAKLLVDNPFIHSAVAFSLEAYYKAGGYLHEKFEDYSLWIRMSQIGKVYLSGNVTVVHNKLPGSLSDINRFDSICYRLSYQLIALKRYPLSKFLVNLIRAILYVNSIIKGCKAR